MLLIFISGTQTVIARNSTPTAPKSLIGEALSGNPDYLALQNQWHAAKAQVPQAGALPDPTLGLALGNLPVNSFAFDQEPMTGKKLSLMQMLPFPGKLGTKQDIAGFQAQALEQQVREFSNQLVKNVKLAYYTIFLIDKSITIVKRNKGLLQQFIRIAETKYAVGKGLQQDVLKAQVELSKLTDKLISLNQMRATAGFKLNTLLNRPTDAVVPTIDSVAQSALPQSLDELKSIGLNQRPLLLGWQMLIEKSTKATRLAKLSYLPDFSLGVAYTQRNDLANGMIMHDFFSAEVKLNLPIWFFRKQSKLVEEKQYAAKSIQEKFQQIKNQVSFQIEDNYQELQKHSTLLELYRTGIIPQASQSLNAALAGYQVDKVDFLTLINNQMTLFNYELEYYRVLAEHEKTMAKLEAAVGVRIDNEESGIDE